MSSPLQWRSRTVPAPAVEAIASRHALPPLAARVLAARGWQPGAALTAFLEDAGPPMPDPLELIGVRKAAERLWQAIDKGERIAVCGDYDVDGITGTALLMQCLTRLGAQVTSYLPHRFRDGYGLNAGVLRDLDRDGARVIITVDNGISSHEELALAAALGMDAIVTDHHQPPETLPEAVAIVNPKLMESPGPFASLAGVGVAYMLACGMLALRPVEGDWPDSLLELVAIGTLGDMAPLVGLNRRLVKAGLSRIASRPRLGLAALASETGVSLAAEGLAEAIGYRLIPRLNAAGRMAHPRLALELLLAEDTHTARQLAATLSQLNRERQHVCERLESDCNRLLEGTLEDDCEAIVLADESWHQGVLGIIASRLAERYGCPAFLFTWDGSSWRGSGRSARGINLHAALTAVSDQLLRYGGHAEAVGLNVPEGGLESFTRALLAECRKQTGNVPQEPRWQVDAEVGLGELTTGTVESLRCLEPTGQENPTPTFAIRGVKVRRQGVRGAEGQHLWLELDDRGTRMEAMGFGMGHLYPLPDQVDAVFVAETDRWQGRYRLRLRLLALEPSLAKSLKNSQKPD